ncbi:DUF6624 domain-containing protein [Pseudoduganella umbonata]|uniref:Uncharacterized protein n=1 Tax=Pseudoduganella umbonata TaxID=864828 RepID=A0A4P8HNG9_9BURK|nr:DUF6624 domain-containing protein [Pseudoduganella umbonata]MBB3219844.1 hypothetical protein [Pseudoduganella umbonata]QCP09875.1 hypothetical protein FCL38_05130 [Pseudoduganella umbonata]
MAIGLFCFVPAAHADECEGSALASIYSRMLSDDQALRGRYIEILERENAKVSVDAAEKAKIEDLILAGDFKNQEELDRLIKLCGWPNSIDNGKAVRSAYFIIQHAPLPYQLKYLPVVRGANKRGEISNEKLASLEDRILVRQGRGQRYGTEFQHGSNKIFPIHDSKNVNKRRKEIGLPPLSGFPR